jgi:hypothetical protein
MVRDIEQIKLEEHFADQEGYQRQQLEQKHCPRQHGRGWGMGSEGGASARNKHHWN